MEHTGIDLEVGSLVFAKVSGHPDPPWPAMVTRFWDKDEYEVGFYGTNQVGYVSLRNIWKYNENSIAKFNVTQFKSMRKEQKFRAAMKQIQEIAIGLGLLQTNNSKFATGKDAIREVNVVTKN